MWVRTVFTETNITAAISSVLSNSERWPRTSVSFAVRGSMNGSTLGAVAAASRPDAPLGEHLAAELRQRIRARCFRSASAASVSEELPDGGEELTERHPEAFRAGKPQRAVERDTSPVRAVRDGAGGRPPSGARRRWSAGDPAPSTRIVDRDFSTPAQSARSRCARPSDQRADRLRPALRAVRSCGAPHRVRPARSSASPLRSGGGATASRRCRARRVTDSPRRRASPRPAHRVRAGGAPARRPTAPAAVGRR